MRAKRKTLAEVEEAEDIEDFPVHPGEPRRTAFIFLRSGILVRNFVNREIIRAMRNSGHRFVIFAPEPDHPYLARHFSDPCFVFARMDTAAGRKALGGTLWRDFLMQVRRFTYGNTRFSENGCRQSLIAALQREQMMAASAVGKLYYRSILLVASYASRWRLIRGLLRSLEVRTAPYDAHAKYYDRYRPDMAIVTSLGFDQDSLVMREARRHGAKVMVVVKNWDVPTTRGVGAVVPDHVLVWNETMRAEVARYHDVPENRIEISGISQWDHYFRDDAAVCSEQSFFQRYGLSPERRTIYFAMTTPSHYKHNVTLTRILLQMIRDGRIAEPAQLLVRLHPTYVLIDGLLSDEVRDELSALQDEFGSLLAFSYPTSEDHNGFLVPGDRDDMDLKEILTYSDMMVTVYSTQILEGTIFNLPIINAGMFSFRDTGLPIATYEDWDHIRQVLDRDAIRYVYDESALADAIDDALRCPERGSAARQRIAEEQFIAELRGRGGEETGRRLLRLLEDAGEGR